CTAAVSVEPALSTAAGSGPAVPRPLVVAALDHADGDGAWPDRQRVRGDDDVSPRANDRPPARRGHAVGRTGVLPVPQQRPAPGQKLALDPAADPGCMDDLLVRPRVPQLRSRVTAAIARARIPGTPRARRTGRRAPTTARGGHSAGPRRRRRAPCDER